MPHTCFVIQGFGEKTDFETGRKLNLDASYVVIKEAVEEAGLKCIRADEVQHAGVIDKPMYEWILDADLVIADLSTSNLNAVYELGVRHAVRSHTTIIVAENGFTKAFDIRRNLIRSYKHLGEDIGLTEARRFKQELSKAIKDILPNPETDSPLYTYVPELKAPMKSPKITDRTSGTEIGSDETDTKSADFATLLKRFRTAKAETDWDRARVYLEDLQKHKPGDSYITQQLALATYKGDKTDKVAALNKAKIILSKLDPDNTHDAETLGLWGAIHKRLWRYDSTNRTHLENATRAYERGFHLRNDYYNGINYAYLLNIRATLTDMALADAVTDWITAQRVRQQVIRICKTLLHKVENTTAEDKQTEFLQDKDYWITATLWEAYVGIDDHANAVKWEQETRKRAREQWMVESTESQLASIKQLLTKSPLKYLHD
jgi:hypothetical protein